MTYTKEEMAEMSGEKAYRKPKSMQLNTITFNGKDGHFVFTDILAGKDINGKYQKKDIGKHVEVVFLKIRRILSKYKKSPAISLQTNEHSTSKDTVMLYGANEKGKASDLREKYPELRTQQIVYAYVKDLKQMVRLSVKGSSLGSTNKSKEVKGFYDYLSSFPNDEHTFEYITILKPVEEQSDLGSYYAMNFIQGEKITDEVLKEEVSTNLAKAFESIKTIDDYYRNSDTDKINNDNKEDDSDNQDFPEEDINPEDIPF